jgi:hypothetical protein
VQDEGSLQTLDWGAFVSWPVRDDVLFCEVLATYGTGETDLPLLDGTDPHSSDGDSSRVQRFRLGTALIYRPASWAELGCGVSVETMALGSLLGISMGPAEPLRGFSGEEDTSFSLTPHVSLGVRW